MLHFVEGNLARLLQVFLVLNFLSFADGRASDIEDARLAVLLEQPFIIVPLGKGCQLGMHLKDHGLYLASFPIDWMVTRHFPSLLALIENEFEDLVDFSLLQIKHEGGAQHILHKRYQIELPHILKTDEWGNSEQGLVPQSGNQDEIVAITDKYRRRAERFKAVVNLSKPVFFIRYGITEQQAIALCNLLEKKWPHCDFKLVCVNNRSNDTDCDGVFHSRIIWEYLNAEYDLNQRLHGKRHPAFTRLFTKLGWIGKGGLNLSH